MVSYQEHLATHTETLTKLVAELKELKRLCERVKKAELSLHPSGRTGLAFELSERRAMISFSASRMVVSISAGHLRLSNFSSCSAIALARCFSFMFDHVLVSKRLDKDIDNDG